MNIKEVEAKLAQELSDALKNTLHDLSYSLPKQYQVRVSLLGKKRKTRSDASANSWSPESGGKIEIRFEPALFAEKQIGPEIPQTTTNRPQTPCQEAPSGAPGGNTYVQPAVAELLRALDRTESRPGWSFVPLKKFRDEILPMEPRELCPSLRTDVEQRHILEFAIEKRFVLVGKVPNPKAPQFPVTTVRLNRLMPEVKAALGQNDNSDLDFRPIEIRGEPLSATILRERR